MDLAIRIEKNLPAIVEGAVSFETGATKEQIAASPHVVYEHHGAEFSTLDKSALMSFYEDLLLGRAMPSTLATPEIKDIDTVVAIALFLHRDLATHPNMPAFVHAVDFSHRLGIVGLAHLDDHLARFLSALRAYFPEKGLSQRAIGERLKDALKWIRIYVHEGIIPLQGSPPPVDVRVLDQGTSGFVVAELRSGPFLDGWVELYRMGYLRGLLVGQDENDRRKSLITKKSAYLTLDLTTAASVLNQMESAMGELPEWRVASDGLWLESPKHGSLIRVKHLIEVLTRV